MAEDRTPQEPTSPADSEPAVKPATALHAPEQNEPSSTDAPAASALPPIPVPVPDTSYTPAGVPTLEGVREKIETRLGTALGATELAEETPEGKTANQQFEARQRAAENKLEEIRSSMRKPG